MKFEIGSPKKFYIAGIPVTFKLIADILSFTNVFSGEELWSIVITVISNIALTVLLIMVIWYFANRAKREKNTKIKELNIAKEANYDIEIDHIGSDKPSKKNYDKSNSTSKEELCNYREKTNELIRIYRQQTILSLVTAIVFGVTAITLYLVEVITVIQQGSVDCQLCICATGLAAFSVILFFIYGELQKNLNKYTYKIDQNEILFSVINQSKFLSPAERDRKLRDIFDRMFPYAKAEEKE